MEITSVNNELVKEYSKLQQKKYRTQSGKFLLEGYKPIKEAFDFGIEIEKVFVEKKDIAKYEFCKDKVIETNSAVIKKLSTTDTAPDAVAAGYQKIYDNDILTKSKKVILLENIKDSGNLGTIVRTAAAFRADAIVIFGDSVDIYNPKVVRASVGNLWKIPIIHIEKIDELKSIFKDFSKIATLPRSTNLLKTHNCGLPCLLMFGSEADGLSEALINLATDSVKIEMAKTVESLNLATSVAIITYELFMNRGK